MNKKVKYNTLENINNKVLSELLKFKKILNILKQNFKNNKTLDMSLNEQNISVNNNIDNNEFSSEFNYTINIINDINNIYSNYVLNSINIISDYHFLSNKNIYKKNMFYKDKKNKIFNKYINYLERNNINKNIKLINNKINNIIDNSKIKDKLYILISNIKHNNNNIKNQIIDDKKNNIIKNHYYSICNICNNYNEYDLNNLQYKLICKVCGKIHILYGTIQDQYYNTNMYDSNNNNISGYDPSKHCKFWLDRIQAKENINIDPKCLDAIQLLIERDKLVDKKKITCKKIRQYLRIINYSKYNENVSLIRKIITNISPPEISPTELHLINKYFINVIKVYRKCKPKNKQNCLYHPYIIYKLIELVIKDKKKQINLLNCIHLQSAATLVINDKIWKKICSQIDYFKYYNTDRNKYLCR
tara:strand:+ start:7085 stop:8335 length:1251 start_codon:yes stop_codon:yes gene_type:complete